MLLRRRSSETNLLDLAIPSMRGTIICCEKFGVLCSSLDFKRQGRERLECSLLHLNSWSARNCGLLWIIADFYLKFGKFGLMFIRQFLGTSYHSFQRVFKEVLKRVLDQFCWILSSLRATNVLPR